MKIGKMLAAIGGVALALSGPGASAVSAANLKDICGDCRFEKVVTCGEFLEGINFDKDGHIWAVSLFSGDILQVVDGKCVTRVKTGGHANGARFDKDGRLFITDNARGILIFDPRTNALSVFADKIGDAPMIAANDLVFDDAGGLYVTVPGSANFLDPSGQVVYFPAGSNVARVIADHLPYPNGVALTPDGKFVNIGLYDAKEIMTIPSMQNAQSKRGPYIFAHTEGGVGPDGMAMDAQGRLYWGEFLGGAVGVADADGFLLGYMKLPPEAGHQTTNLAFRGGYLYVTEAEKGEIWRVPVKVQGQTLYYHQ
jgi:gluconolactonase